MNSPLNKIHLLVLGLEKSKKSKNWENIQRHERFSNYRFVLIHTFNEHYLFKLREPQDWWKVSTSVNLTLPSNMEIYDFWYHLHCIFWWRIWVSLKREYHLIYYCFDLINKLILGLKEIWWYFIWHVSSRVLMISQSVLDTCILLYFVNFAFSFLSKKSTS